MPIKKVHQKVQEIRERWPTWHAWFRRIGIIVVVIAAIAIPVISTVRQAVTLPASLTLPVPFTTQAPDGNWTGNENCEEASVVMADAFLTGNTEDTIPADAAETAIDNLISWENANFGHNANGGSAEIAQMAETVDQLKANVISNYTEVQLKTALRDGQVILLTVNASKLNNPNYTQPPPTYHVVVIRGYNGDTFYANDPGIEKGNNYAYPFATLQAANADWDNTNNVILNGQGKAIILSK